MLPSLMTWLGDANWRAPRFLRERASSTASTVESAPAGRQEVDVPV